MATGLKASPEVQGGPVSVTDHYRMAFDPPISTAGLHPYRLRLRRPWRTASGEWTERRGWLVRLETEDGVVGFGDCAPLPEVGTEAFPVAEATLRELVSGASGHSAAMLLDGLDGCHDTPASRCGVECALLDILSKREARPLANWLNSEAHRTVCLNAALGSLEGDPIRRARQAVTGGFQVLKVKLGVMSLGQEVEGLNALAKALPPGVSLRLDANGSWEEASARDLISAIKDLPIESLEEPVRDPQWDTLERLQALAPWPIALDESLAHWPLDELFGQVPVRRLVLKPMVLGGVLPAMALAIRARAEDVSTVVTTTVDSAAGVCVASHLAAALDGDAVHGLATSDWLAEDVGAPPRVVAARLLLDDGPGVGFRPNPGLCFQ